MSRKVFTAGEVLAAADVNSFLMDQTVMSFAGTAARGSAIPSPVEGMYTHLEDTDDLQFWNGSAWVSNSPGLVLINSTSFTSSSLVRVNDCFSSRYENYLIKLDEKTSGSNVTFMRFLTSTNTPTATTLYQGVGFAASFAGGVVNYSGNNQANILVGVSTNVNGSSSTIEVHKPFETKRTAVFNQIIVHESGTAILYAPCSSYDADTSFPGFEIYTNTGTMTGVVRVYGYRNA